MANLACAKGYRKDSANTPCEDCAYFRRAAGLPTNVLVISSDVPFIDDLRQQEPGDMTLRFARNAYDASAIISDFRPGFVIVDGGLAAPGTDEPLDNLMADSRIPGVRIMLGVPKTRATPILSQGDKRIVKVLQKTFGYIQISAVINKFPVELVSAGDGSSGFCPTACA